MTDIEKVISGLDSLYKSMHEHQCYACNYNYVETEKEFGTEILANASELIESQQEEIESLKQTAQSMMEGIVVSQPQIVRCKDCKHKEESVSPSWEAWCNRLHCGCDLDWFCADGERRNDDA